MILCFLHFHNNSTAAKAAIVATTVMAETMRRAGMPTTAAMAAPAETVQDSSREGKDVGGNDSDNTSDGSNSVNGGEGTDCSNSRNGGERWQRPQK